jgi:mono/diheme cytochrome c family protein
MTTKLVLAIALSAVAGMSFADDLCAVNPYSKSEAEQGKIAFESHCALCHQYNLTGRIPGNYLKESPDINLLSESDLKFLDGGGGAVPPLVGDKFFSKQKGKTLAEFSAFVSGAANTFPPKNTVVPLTYFQVAAYVLYKNCGKM